MPKKRILIIDDEVAITKMLKIVLERTGHYEVSYENKGVNALSAIRAFSPDLILLDVNLPDVAGGEIMAELKQRPTLKKIPVVFLTGMISNEEAQSGLTVVGRPVVAKPVNMQKLQECIEQTLTSPPDPDGDNLNG